MGISTYGQICFGVQPKDDSELPWDNEDDEFDLEYWWLRVRGCPEREEGQGWKEWFDQKEAWLSKHPCPVSAVNTCSCDYPVWVLAVPRTAKASCRGYPKEISHEDLTVTPEEVEALEAFCTAFNIDYDGEPRWLLSSYLAY